MALIVAGYVGLCAALAVGFGSAMIMSAQESDD
jgi:hypothetical protein